MAAAARGRSQLTKHFKEREPSPERTVVWSEPKPKPNKACVVYYLSRNGLLEHPHFMEVTLSSRDGLYLYLRDVVNRLNFLRGNGMANMYSWSSKRSYKNGFVWHDLSEDDIIHPTHGQEYVLKGSQLLHSFSSASNRPTEITKSVPEETDFHPLRRKKTPWSSFDLGEYKVYKSDFAGGDTSAKAADAATQTEDKRFRVAFSMYEDDDASRGDQAKPEDDSPTTELAREEISPPPSSSSTETLESLMKADGRVVVAAAAAIKEVAAVEGDDHGKAAASCPSGRFRASAVLKQLISCASLSSKDHGGFSPGPPEHSGRLPRGCPDDHKKETDNEVAVTSNSAIRLEEKEYFSGSFIETQKKNTAGAGPGPTPALTRSFSYNADRNSKTGVEDMEGSRGKCIPRKQKAMVSRRGA